MVVAGSGERVSSHFIMSYTNSIGERSGNLASPAETPNVTMSCNWWPPTPWSLRWGLCVVGKCTPEDDAHQVCAVHMCVHHSHTDWTYSHHWRQQNAIPLSSRLCHNTSVAMLHGVSSSLARGTCDLSPAASRRFPMVLGGTADVTCAWISSLDAVWAATIARTMHQSWCVSVLHGCPELGLRMWECSTRLLLKAVIHHQYIVPQYVQQSIDMSIQLSAGLQCDPIQMAEVVQQEYVLSAGHGCTLEWIFKHFYLSKHHDYCL